MIIIDNSICMYLCVHASPWKTARYFKRWRSPGRLIFSWKLLSNVTGSPFLKWIICLRIAVAQAPQPIGSMYGIFTYIWLIFMANVGVYTIHGSYGQWKPSSTLESLDSRDVFYHWDGMSPMIRTPTVGSTIFIAISQVSGSVYVEP